MKFNKRMQSYLPKVLFFDIGGVLLSNGWGHESRQKAAQKFDLDYESLNSLHSFIFNVYEIGRISLDEYLDTGNSPGPSRILLLF